MKCSECGQEMRGPCFSFAYRGPSDQWYVANYCQPCFDHLLGRPLRNRMIAVLGRAGWVQERLPV